VNSLFLYAAYLASRGSEHLSPPRNGDPSASPAQLLATVAVAAAVLTEVARAAPPGTQVFRPAGMADVSGWIGIGCEEILLHPDAIARGLGLTYRPPDHLAAWILTRLFPWAPSDIDPWDNVRRATGRAALPDHERMGPDWHWHCPPLSEWDGTITKRTSPPARR